MDENKQKSSLWKTYGILMGIMIGGSALILGGQSIWNNIREGQARAAAAEEQAYSKYTQVLQKISDRYELPMPAGDRNNDISKARQYCSDFTAGKTNLQQDWAGVSKLSLKQAILLAQVQSSCPENLVKLPKEVQTQLATLDNITQKQATAVVKRWLESKKRLFAPPFDKQLGAELLTGKAYQDNIDKTNVSCNDPSGCLSSIDWLRANNAEYSFEYQNLDSVDKFESSTDNATILVTVTERRTLHQSGKNTSSGGKKQARYILKNDNNVIKILEYKVLN
jgi:ARC6-like, IMS domain